LAIAHWAAQNTSPDADAFFKHQHINRRANGNGFKPAATSANQPTLISIAGF